jgi:hypothetical protein
MKWREPRRVDRWWWMDIEIYNPETSSLIRSGRVSWDFDKAGDYSISMDYAQEGIGLCCWPAFCVLADAQDFVECLMTLPLDQAKKIHGMYWPGFVVRSTEAL